MRRVDPERVTGDIGRRIAELRRESRMTQEQLAVKLGSSFQWVAQLEAGRNVTVTTLVRLANALRVPVGELLRAPTTTIRARRRGRPSNASAEIYAQRRASDERHPVRDVAPGESDHDVAVAVARLASCLRALGGARRARAIRAVEKLLAGLED